VEDLSGQRRIGRIQVEPEASLADARSQAEALGGLFDGISVVRAGGAPLASVGTPLLWITINGHDFPLSPDSFFQANRHLVSRLALDVGERALAPQGRALDAFGGVGLLAGALLERGHRVTSVESYGPAVELAGQTKERWGLREDSWTIVSSPMLAWIRTERDLFDLAVVDPPRAGLGKELAGAIADRVRNRIVYVSCEPATLARDLAALESRGFQIAHARLYDFFAFTHRVEALVTLERKVPR
jgi:tRNA/tmRNA/rRNA uracil-C5-methylase (TrmA/RlmC/RlmD family)